MQCNANLAFKHPAVAWVRNHACLCLFLLFSAPGAALAQAKAHWVSSTQLTTRCGFATLRWSVEGAEAVALFRLREEHSGEHQITYTDQPEMQVKKREPGDYSFWVQACKRYADGYPMCGESSRRLTLSVIDEDAGSPSRSQSSGSSVKAASNR